MSTHASRVKQVIYGLVAMFASFYASILVLDYGYFPRYAAQLYDALGLASYLPVRDM